ncbi:MAG: hypothetical protein JST54_26135 [Deltaproteobacteria bacterium]|nr:hypothetical protein [Deltaproteobacteria bacterium]
MRAASLAIVLAIALGAPRSAGATYVGDELSLGTTRPTPENPRSGTIGETLYGSIDASQTLSFMGRLSLLHDDAVAPQAGANFGAGGGNVLLFTTGVDWEATKHFNLAATIDYSPKAQQNSDSTLTLDTAAGTTLPVDSLLRTNASSFGATLTLAYDTMDLDAETPSNFEWAFAVNLGAMRLNSQQSIAQLAFYDKLTNRERTLSVSAINDTYCPKHPKQPICKVAANLTGQTESLSQFPLEADMTVTLYENTDVGLAVTYFAYSEDPTALGFFTVSAAGRTSRPSGSLEFGAGMPLAPEQLVVRPDVGHAFGPVYADLYAEYGNYLDDQGHEVALGLKLKWRINHNWRIYGLAVLSRETPGPGLTADADPQSDATLPVITSAFTLGLRYTF